MADFRCTIPVNINMTWDELKRAATIAGVPDSAKINLHEHKSYSAMDYDQARIEFTWSLSLPMLNDNG